MLRLSYPCNRLILSLGPHGAYFHMRKLKSQVAKVSTVASVMRDKQSIHFLNRTRFQ